MELNFGKWLCLTAGRSGRDPVEEEAVRDILREATATKHAAVERALNLSCVAGDDTIFQAASVAVPSSLFATAPAVGLAGTKRPVVGSGLDVNSHPPLSLTQTGRRVAGFLPRPPAVPSPPLATVEENYEPSPLVSAHMKPSSSGLDMTSFQNLALRSSGFNPAKAILNDKPPPPPPMPTCAQSIIRVDSTEIINASNRSVPPVPVASLGGIGGVQGDARSTVSLGFLPVSPPLPPEALKVHRVPQGPHTPPTLSSIHTSNCVTANEVPNSSDAVVGQTRKYNRNGKYGTKPWRMEVCGTGNGTADERSGSEAPVMEAVTALSAEEDDSVSNVLGPDQPTKRSSASQKKGEFRCGAILEGEYELEKVRSNDRDEHID